MNLELNSFALELTLLACRDGHFFALPMSKYDGGWRCDHRGLRAELLLNADSDRIAYTLRFNSPYRTRLRLQISLPGQSDLFHLIPGNIHGDNNAAHVRAGEFPCLTATRSAERNRAALWEFRADRASHPVSILCCQRGVVGISIDPYSECEDADDGFIRNGVFAALPDRCGVSLGYGNDPLTFVEKTHFTPATADLSYCAQASGAIYAERGNGRLAAHRIIRQLYEQLQERPTFEKPFDQALVALANAFATISYSPQLRQYTNVQCKVPTDLALRPWRAVVEIGWTGGSMLAYPFALAERIIADLKLPKSSAQIFDEIISGFNERSGFINDAAVNRFTRNRPAGWNDSEINGWWSGFLPQTRDNHCAYTNGHAAYYLLKAASLEEGEPGAQSKSWIAAALRVLDTVIELQRDDGAFGYIFSSRERKVIDFDGFAGCWFAAAAALASDITGLRRYRDAVARALEFYHSFVRDLACWGSPMDTFKSIDSEGNLAFIRAARLMHELSDDDHYLAMLVDGANYEYLWRYGFCTRAQCPPLKGSNWNSCGGSVTSVSNPHIHPMSVVATQDLEYLAAATGDATHASRAADGMAWLMNTLELYPAVTGYGRYGVLSERTCPSDGLLAERYGDDGAPASTWWSYNAWAAGSAMEAIAEQVLSERGKSSCGRTHQWTT
jgi:hypothetical protein